MIKNLRYLFIIFLAVSAFSCKKEEKNTTTLKEELADKWYYDSISQKDYDQNGKLTKTTSLPVLVNVNYIDFKADDTFTAVVRQEVEPKKFENVTSTGTYKVTSLTKFTVTQQGVTAECNLRNLNASQLRFTQDIDTRVAGQPYSVIEHVLHR
ncbi:hypothetical protein [uncultured Mucilaginibacter sp.]|uniref:hypothetical protein n=1 Tax=uncultured Mucilaginibacter sp. TaxID=797541 RepID=UPI0025ED60A7|nr:hypothetical protein [uncultured Mucilaginibacter sp.]